MVQAKKILFTLISLISTTAVHAGFYLNAGVGGAFSSTETSFRENSSSVLYSPTATPSGSSLFTLPNVNWHNNFKNGFNLNAALGYHFNSQWRSEAEFLYQNIQRSSYGTYGRQERDSLSGAVYAFQMGNHISKVNTRAHVYSLLSNLAHDFDSILNWTPFLGAGFGISWLQSTSLTTNNIISIDDPNTPIFETAPARQTSPSLYGTGFTWQFKTGLSHELSTNTSILLQYRVLGTTDFRASTSLITSNPGTTGASNFYIASHDINGLLTQVVDINIRWDV